MKYNLHELKGNDQICVPAYCGKKLLSFKVDYIWLHVMFYSYIATGMNFDLLWP